MQKKQQHSIHENLIYVQYVYMELPLTFLFLSVEAANSRTMTANERGLTTRIYHIVYKSHKHRGDDLACIEIQIRNST